MRCELGCGGAAASSAAAPLGSGARRAQGPGRRGARRARGPGRREPLGEVELDEEHASELGGGGGCSGAVELEFDHASELGGGAGAHRRARRRSGGDGTAAIGALEFLASAGRAVRSSSPRNAQASSAVGPSGTARRVSLLTSPMALMAVGATTRAAALACRTALGDLRRGGMPRDA